MNKFFVLSALIAVCSATDLLAPTILKAAPVVHYAAPAITSYSYETRQVHPGQAIALAAAPLHAPLVYSAPLAGPTLVSSKVLAAPTILSAPLLAPKLLSAPYLSAPTILSGPTLLGKSILIKK